MAEPRARIIDSMKFMWDGKEYEGIEPAEEARREYEKDDFETRIVDEDGEIHVYTRRVVTHVEVEGPPPA